MRRVLYVLPPAAAVTVVAACTIQTIFPPGAPPATASQLVGAGGGLVTADDGTAVLIPAGALTANVTITIALAPDAAPPTGVTAVTTPHVFGPAGQAFAKPVCITLSFEPGLLPAGTTEQNVVLYAEEPADAGGGFAPVPTFAAAPTRVTGMTTTFATMTAAFGGADEMAADAGDAGCGDANFDAAD